MAYSSDGVSWTAVTDSTFGVYAVSTIAYGDGKFVAMGGNGQIAYSTDGETWTAGISPVTDIMARSIIYASGKFVAGGTRFVLYSNSQE
jgi:hypothetical protein